MCSNCGITGVSVHTPELGRRKVIILALFFQSVSMEFLRFSVSSMNVLYRNVLIIKMQYICLDSLKKYIPVPFLVTLSMFLNICLVANLSN